MSNLPTIDVGADVQGMPAAAAPRNTREGASAMCC